MTCEGFEAPLIFQESTFTAVLKMTDPMSVKWALSVPISFELHLTLVFFFSFFFTISKLDTNPFLPLPLRSINLLFTLPLLSILSSSLHNYWLHCCFHILLFTNNPCPCGCEFQPQNFAENSVNGSRLISITSIALLG